MKALHFALNVLVGIAIIYLIASLSQGTFDMSAWPPKTRDSVAFFSVVWGIMILLFGSDD